MTLATDIIAYLESLRLSQGRLAGQKWRLLPWQRRFTRGAFGQPDDARLTIARGGGKTTYVAGLGAAAIAGPLVEPRAETLIVASSFEQGLTCFRHVLAFVEPEKDRARWRVADSSNRAAIECRRTGAMLRVLGSDPRRLHGAAPKLMLLDEVAQWPSTNIDRMLSALTTSRGKIPGSKAIWLGTRAASPEHPFERALNDPVGYSQVHVARQDDPPYRVSTWKKANPSLSTMPDLLAVYRAEARQARADSVKLASFQSLRLNLGVADTVRASLLSAGLWQSSEGEAEQRGPVVWGVDLGGSASMSAVCAFWPDTGRLESLAAFPGTPGLSERGLADGVGGQYRTMAERGELITTTGRVVDVEELLREAMSRFGPPDAVAADRWRESELKDALDLAGVPASAFVSRGMGFKDGAQDVRDFRRACLTGKVVPVVSLLMRAGMSEAVVVSDPAGNEKLAKRGEGGRRSRARDDAAAAGILAVSVGSRRPEPETEESEASYVLVG
jgi:phage terminase large subunit-like protein